MIYTIETDNRPVAITNDDAIVDRLNGLDPVLRQTVRHLKRGGLPLWDGKSPFRSRLATPDEQTLWHWPRLLTSLLTLACFIARLVATPQTAARWRLRLAARLLWLAR
jgi:hypothetical protein